MKTSDAVTEIMPALIAFQAEVPLIAKDATNPHRKSKYAKIEEIRAVINPILSKHNLFVSNYTDYVNDRIVVYTRVYHKSGQWIETPLSLKPENDTPQGLGSCLTYGERYGEIALLNLVIGGDDDDGETASQRLAGSQKSASKGFDPKNPKSLEWIHGVLATTTLPQSEWSRFISSINQLTIEQINEKIREIKRKQ